MQVTFSDFKKGIVKIKVTNIEDLWHLSQIIAPGDLISGRTLRKVSIGEEKKKYSVRSVFIKIKAEQVDYGASVLRVSGKIVESPEDVPKGSYHTFSIEQGSELAVEKLEWLAFHKKQLADSTASVTLVLICILDRDECIIALSRDYKMDILVHINADPEKKESRARSKGGFYQEISNIIEQYVGRYNPESIIIASPAFYKDELAQVLPDSLNVVLATCSSVNESALGEILRRPETRTAFKTSRLAAETAIIDKLMLNISKGKLAAYGLDQVKRAIGHGAVENLLVTDEFVRANKKELSEIMVSVEKIKGSTQIINSAHEPGKMLQSLGGIAALLRFAV